MQCGCKCPHLDNVDATPRLLSPTTSSSPRATNRLAQILPSDLSARPSLPLGLPSGRLWLCICRIPLVAHFPQRPKPFSSAYALASCSPEISNKMVIAALSYAATTSAGLMRQIRFSCEVPINDLVLQMMTPELREAFNFFPVTMPASGPRAAQLQYELSVLLSSLKICLSISGLEGRKVLAAQFFSFILILVSSVLPLHFPPLAIFSLFHVAQPPLLHCLLPL